MANSNVKISELTTHQLNTINGEEMIPMSWSSDGTSSYESYKVFLKDIITYSGAYTPEINHLERDLGQYKNSNEDNYCPAHSETITIGVDNTAIKKDGTTVTNNAWAISIPISVSEGTLYLLNIGKNYTLPAGYVLFAKRHVHTYYPITGYEDKQVTITHDDGTTETITVREPVYGDAQTEVVYEPRSFHYEANGADHGYGIPGSGYVVFLAPEDEEIVVSFPKARIADMMLHAVHYGVFSEIAEKFLGTNSDLSKVISEAISELEGRVKSLESNIATNDFEEINVMQMPKYRGGDMIIISDRSPISYGYYVDEYGEPVTYGTTSAYYHAADRPIFSGQIWVNTSDIIAYMGFGNTWKPISITA